MVPTDIIAHVRYLKKLKHLKAKVPKYPSDVYPAKM
jgi:hypothetical protein